MIKFINSYTAAIVQEPEHCGGDVRLFRLSKVACLKIGEFGELEVMLDGGETFYVTREDFESLAANLLGHNVNADDPWS